MSTTRWDGDIALENTEDGGAIIFAAGQPAMEGGLATAVYISLFTDGGWWADALAPVEERNPGPSPGELEDKPLTNKTRLDFEERARTRLAWLVEQGVAASVTVEASIVGVNRLDVAVAITEPDAATAQTLRYRVLWQGQRAALGGI